MQDDSSPLLHPHAGRTPSRCRLWRHPCRAPAQHAGVPGELVALIGANGAGKSTTLRAICGLVPLAAGRIHYQGQSLAGQPVHAMVRQGLVMVPEGRGIFPQLTIEENLHMGAYSRSDKAAIAQEVEQVYTRFPRLAERRRQTAGTLSGGEQQMLAMGRAILSNPSYCCSTSPPWAWPPSWWTRSLK